jgi:ABC-type lipoprotein release transport system permease subunit
LAFAAITLTVAVPILVLSVVQGFVDITARQARANESDLTVLPAWGESGLPARPSIQRRLMAESGIVGAAPFTQSYALAQPRDRRLRSAFALVNGIDWASDSALGRLHPGVLHRAPVMALDAPPLTPGQRGTGFLTPSWRDHLALVSLDLGLGMPLPLPPRPTPLPGLVTGSELLYASGNRIGSRLQLNSAEGRITGEISDTLATGLLEVDNYAILVPLAGGQTLAGLDARQGQEAQVSGWRLRVGPGENEATVGRRLAARTGLRVETWMDRRGNLVRSFEISRNIMALVMIAIQGIAVFIVYAVFSTLVAEKRHDIGVLLGLGARRRDIAGAFLFAGLTACVLGGLCGWALGWGAVAALNPLSKILGVPLFPQDVMYLPEAPTSYDPAIPCFFIGVMTLVGLVAVALPAWRASRVSPVDILREGA